MNGYALGGSREDLLSHNVFAYAKNNPVNVIDPSGCRAKWMDNIVGDVSSFGINKALKAKITVKKVISSFSSTIVKAN